VKDGEYAFLGEDLDKLMAPRTPPPSSDPAD
jgi:hypothetical protein